MYYSQLKINQDSIKTHGLGLGVLLGCSFFFSGLAHDQLTTYRELTRVESEARIHQAKELLGNQYKQSLVKFAEHEDDVSSFIYEQSLSLLPQESKFQATKIAEAILRESSRYHLDPIFTLAVIAHESKFRPNAIGTHGEIGLMQIKPDTAAWIAGKSGLPWLGNESLKNPEVNIRIGTAYISMLRQRFDAKGSLYLAAYNMGAVKLRRALSNSLFPKDYFSKVMRKYVGFYRMFQKNPMILPVIQFKATAQLATVSQLH